MGPSLGLDLGNFLKISMPWLPLKEIVNLIYSVELAAQLLAHNAKCLAVNSSAVTVKEKKRCISRLHGGDGWQQP